MPALIVRKPIVESNKQMVKEMIAKIKTAAVKNSLRSLVIAGVIVMALPSCKHGSCDAYQGSSRSTGKAKRKSVNVIQRTNLSTSTIS